MNRIVWVEAPKNSIFFIITFNSHAKFILGDATVWLSDAEIDTRWQNNQIASRFFCLTETNRPWPCGVLRIRNRKKMIRYTRFRHPA